VAALGATVPGVVVLRIAATAITSATSTGFGWLRRRGRFIQ